MVNPVESLGYVYTQRLAVLPFAIHVVINYAANCFDSITTPDTHFFEAELIIRAHQKSLITIKDTVFKYFGQCWTNGNSPRPTS